MDLRESPETVRAFIAASGVHYPILLDTSGQVGSQFGVRGIPTAVLINKFGKQVWRDYRLPQPDEIRDKLK